MFTFYEKYPIIFMDYYAQKEERGKQTVNGLQNRIIKQKIKKIVSDNRGSAIITALIVSVVMMFLCLSVLLVAFSLFSTVTEGDSDLKNRELIYSAVTEIEQEIVSAGPDYSTLDGLKSAMEKGEDNLWFFLRCNLWQKKWPYYDEKEKKHNDIVECSRYFEIEVGEAADSLRVQLYWEKNGATDGDKSGTVLHAVFRLMEKGELKNKVEREYLLEMAEIPHTSKEKKYTPENSGINPLGNKINPWEKWTWTRR